MKIEALGDSAVVVSLGRGIDESALPLSRELAEAITRVRAPAVFDAVPAFATVAVYYDPVRLAGFSGKPYDNICRFIASCAEGIDKRSSERRGQAMNYEIPPMGGAIS